LFHTAKDMRIKCGASLSLSSEFVQLCSSRFPNFCTSSDLSHSLKASIVLKLSSIPRTICFWAASPHLLKNYKNQLKTNIVKNKNNKKLLVEGCSIKEKGAVRFEVRKVSPDGAFLFFKPERNTKIKTIATLRRRHCKPVLV